jgi:hypothetical protein
LGRSSSQCITSLARSMLGNLRERVLVLMTYDATKNKVSLRVGIKALKSFMLSILQPLKRYH